MQSNGNKNGNGMGINAASVSCNFFSRLFNIAPSQWPRVSECWLVTFFFKLGAAIGWTVLTAAFVARFGIALLPTLFVVNAIFIILSTIFFEEMITRVKREVLMIQMLLMAALCLFLATFIYNTSPLGFFALVISAESIFLAQFNVFIPILVGDRFTPLESQRTFPFIESGETIGGIMGGALVGLFAFKMSIPFFLYLWIGALACIIVVFVVTSSIGQRLPHLIFRESRCRNSTKTDELKLVFKGIAKIPFLKGLILIVLFQWIFMNILEFQYTKAIEQKITGTQETTIAHVDPKVYQVALISSAEGVQNLRKTESSAHYKRKLTEQQQADLTNKLGTLKSTFHIAALLVQAIVASRLITSLGIVGALLLHPVMMLMSLVGMFLKFGFISSIIAKGSFELTNVVHKNAYFASHYAFPNYLKDQAAEFLEGIVRPMGTIVGMLGILGLQLLFSGKELTMWIHMMMLIIMVIILIVTTKLQPSYTRVTEEQLFSSLPYPEKLNAIEILAQRGHKNAPLILTKKLREIREKKSPETGVVQVKILSALSQFCDYRTLPDIIDALYDKEAEVRLEASHALMGFRNIGAQFYTQAFSRYRMIEALKEVFRNENSSTIRRAIIRVFSLVREPNTIAFLLDVLRDESPDVKADCIYTLGLFQDPTSAYYILPFLLSDNAKIRANAIVALWQFHSYHSVLREHLDALLSSTYPEEIRAGVFAVGEIGNGSRISLKRFLDEKNPDIKIEAAYALSKSGDIRACTILLETFLNESVEEFDGLRRFVRRLDRKTKRTISHLIIQMISHELNELTSTSSYASLDQLDTASLERLQRLYRLLDKHEELYTIEKVLQQKKQTVAA